MALPPDISKYLDSKGLAKRHKITEGAVRVQRHQGRGPPYVLFGGRILYEIKAVEKWEQDQLKKQIKGD